MQNLNTHMNKTGIIASKFGKFLNLKMEVIEDLYIAGVNHDVGKVMIDEKILNKPSKLTDLEYLEVKKHPDYSKKFLLEREMSEEVIVAVYEHHERIDGKGYPKGLKGNEISLMGRILAICDSYEAMTSKRVYKNALSKEKALKEIKNNLNTQFDEVLGLEFIQFIKASSPIKCTG